MTDQDVRDLLERMAAEEPFPSLDPGPLTRRARRRAARTLVVSAIGVAAAITVLFAGVAEIRTARIPADQPSPTGPTSRYAREVLWVDSSNGDDLLAVNAVTGEERVLVENVLDLIEATPSADGRWVAYETWSATSHALWVVGPELEPRKVIDLPYDADLSWSPEFSWSWSSTGAQLALNGNSTLYVVDPATGLVTDLPASSARVDSLPVWSPDRTRILLGGTGGTIEAFDALTGERSLLVQLPGDDFGPVRSIAWSPDGSRLAVFNDDDVNHVGSGDGRLFLLDADGSNIRVLAQGEFIPSSFDWSPDGSRIAFAEYAENYSRIWIAPIDGSTASTAVTPELHDLWGPPAWSPDGSQVAYSLSPGQAFVIDADVPGDGEPIDDLTYASWSGGSFYWAWFWRSTPSYTGPTDT